MAATTGQQENNLSCMTGVVVCIDVFYASQAMMAALLHWSQANWLGMAADMRQMGLLKPTTDLTELAAELQLRFEQLYANTNIVGGQSPTNTTVDSSVPTSTDSDSTGSGSGSHSSSIDKPLVSSLLQRAGAIGFAEFAGVVAALAFKYRFELPPYYTLVIRSLTTLEGFALLVNPSARFSIARTAVKVKACEGLWGKVGPDHADRPFSVSNFKGSSSVPAHKDFHTPRGLCSPHAPAAIERELN